MSRPRALSCARGRRRSASASCPRRGASGGPGPSSADDLKEWLTYIASDELAGPGTCSPPASVWPRPTSRIICAPGVSSRPAMARAYLQTVRVLGVKSTNRSSITVQVGGETPGRSPTAKASRSPEMRRQADRSRRPRRVRRVRSRCARGRPRRIFAARTSRAQPSSGSARRTEARSMPRSIAGLLAGRNRYATGQLQAAASIGPEARGAWRRRAGRGTRNGWQASARRSHAGLHDHPASRSALAAGVTASDAFFDFLFSRAPGHYDELKRRAAARDDRCPRSGSTA